MTNQRERGIIRGRGRGKGGLFEGRGLIRGRHLFKEVLIQGINSNLNKNMRKIKISNPRNYNNK